MSDQSPTPDPTPDPAPGAPSRRRHGAILGVLGAVVVVAVVVVVVALSGSSSPAPVRDARGTSGRTVVLPAALGGATRNTAIPTQHLKQALGEQLGRLGADPVRSVAHAQVAAYGAPGTPSVIFVSIALPDVPQLRTATDRDGVQRTLVQFMSGAGSKVTDAGQDQAFAPGPLGGFLRCTRSVVDGTPVGLCGWGDESAYALTIVRSPASLQAAADTTRTLREAAEKEPR